MWQVEQASRALQINTTGNLAVNERATQAETDNTSGTPSAATPWRADADGGIDVREEDLGIVQAQQLYQMRCECGRSWFELVLKMLVQCPACHKLGLVAQYRDPPQRDEDNAT